MMVKMKISKEKLAELEAELEALVKARPEIVERVASARELGDLKENSEYHGARDEQRYNVLRSEEIEGILKNYEVIDGSDSDHTEVEIGCKVKLKGDTEKVFTVVSSLEADPLNGKVSDESPIGQLLIGKKVGDEIEIAGKKHKISEIS